MFDISEIEYLFTVLELHTIEYLIFLFLFFFSLFLLFFSDGMAWIVKLSGLTLANKPLNGLHAHIRKMHDIQEVSCMKNVRACIKCSLWIVKEDGQEQYLTCKPNPCFFSFGQNGWHFGHKCLPFSLTWQVSCRCNYWYFGWNLAINRWWIWEKIQE